jgi:hypothetical protein
MEKTAWLKPDADLEGEEAGLEPRYATRRFQLEHHLVEPTGAPLLPLPPPYAPLRLPLI